MLRRNFFYVLVLLFFSAKTIAQVNLQTGSATFSLPIFNWQDDKSRLNSVIALSYSSGNGLRVNDIASNVGQGWSLVTGGTVTRMQVGLPDDQVARDGNFDDVSKYSPGILYATQPAYKGAPIALTKYPLFRNKNQMYAQHNVIGEDKELDYFAFQFNGKSGMFVLDPTNIGVAQQLGDSKMKITFVQDAALQSQGIRTKITSFQIQDVDGLKYKFTRHGLTKVLESNFCHGNLSYRLTQPKFKPDKVYHQTGFENSAFFNPYIITSWELTEIEDPLTLRKVFFNYGFTRNINTYAGQDIIYNVEKNYTIIYHKKTITQTPALTSIVYPDGHTASFNYAGTQRIDFPGEYALSYIDITYLGRNLSRHELNTTYVMLNRYGTPVSDYQKKVARLYLKSVRKIGVDLKEDSPPYIFDYYLGSSTADDFVPPPFFYAKDIWGFYNGDNSKGFWLETIPLNSSASQLSNNQLRGLCFMRNGVSGVVLNAKGEYAKNGLLKQIIYPTGGTLTYEYNQNSGVLGGSTTNVGGVQVAYTKSTDGGYSNSCANPVTTQYSYTVNGPGTASSLWGLEMPVNSTHTTSHYEPESRYYKYDLGCFPFGCCEWRFKFPGISLQQQSISLSDFQRFMEIAGPVFDILGIISTIGDVVTVLGGGNPVALIIDIIVGLIELAVTCIGNQARDNDYTTFFNFDLNSSSPLPAQFKRVEVIENPGPSPGIGKTIQEFTSSDDYAVWENTNQYFTAKQRFAPWAYGLPKKTTVLNASGNTIKQTENLYSFTNAKQIIKPCNNNPEFGLPPCYPTGGIPSVIVSMKSVVHRNVSQRNPNWLDPVQYNNPASYLTASNNDLKVDFYGMYTGRTELTTNKERVYKTNDPAQFVETVTDYEYNLSNYEVKKITVTQSNGDKNINEIRYNNEYGGGIYTTLLNNNIFNIPLTTFNSIIKSGTSTSQDLHETQTALIQLTNGDIKPGTIYERRSDKPYNRTPYPPTLPVTQTFTYDAAGNLIGVKDEGNRTITSLYDYNDKYIAASVINADPDLDKCSYAHFEPSSNGWVGWTLTGTPTYNTTTVMTGTRSLSIASGVSLSRILNTAKPYTVSFWSTTSTISVAGGATLTKSAPTLNGFTYYEYDITQGTSSVTVSGTGVIDELRLYPKTARMQTITYDPLIGKTSDCDINNRITYYEYDNLGRLRFIKDESRNIVKMYEYNNVSPAKQNGCPGSYYNKMISEVFTKSCGAGYIGSNVTYTVAANTYSSTISQADADAQAENNILTNGQNYANTNGTCIPLYLNTLQFQSFTSETCSPGYIGGTVTYTVPAGRYSSTVSQTAANQLALDEIEANGQEYANNPATRVCIYSSDPLWEWLEGAPSYCEHGHLFVLETDINPNSYTYNETRWADVGTSELCPPPQLISLYATNYTSQVQYISVTNVENQQNYFFTVFPGGGYIGDVPEGHYDVSISDGYGWYLNQYDAGCFNYITDYSAYFYNIILSSTCNSFGIYPYGY